MTWKRNWVGTCIQKCQSMWQGIATYLAWWKETLTSDNYRVENMPLSHGKTKGGVVFPNFHNGFKQIKDVLYVPKVTKNLILMGAITDKRFYVVFSNHENVGWYICTKSKEGGCKCDTRWHQ